MSLLQSPLLRATDKPLCSASLPESSYVLSLASLSNVYAASASSPSNKITLFDKSSLRSSLTLSGHGRSTTCLRVARSFCGSTRDTLLSSGKDGCVKAWDERSGSVSVQMVGINRRPLLCCDALHDGFMVAAGTELQKEDAFIYYWDPRNPAAPLRTHGSTHSDDITAVHFGGTPPSTDLLLSTSSDGLVSISNPHQEDDEAVVHVGNLGCSISQGGWIPNSTKLGIWAASDMETFSYWSNELDCLYDVDIRKPTLHDQCHTWVTDYLISCVPSSRTENWSAVFVGSNKGDAALVTNSSPSQPGASWTIHSIWSGGHVGIVRSVLWDEESEVLITGGEDSKVQGWRIPDLHTSDNSDVIMQVDSPKGKREHDVMTGIRVGKRTRH